MSAAATPAGWRVVPIGRAGLGAHAASWNALNHRIGAAHPWRDAGCIGAWLQASGSDATLLCVEDDWTGACVLEPAGARRWQSVLPAPLGAVLVATPASAAALVTALPDVARVIDYRGVDPRVGDLVLHNHARPNGRWRSALLALPPTAHDSPLRHAVQGDLHTVFDGDEPVGTVRAAVGPAVVAFHALQGDAARLQPSCLAWAAREHPLLSVEFHGLADGIGTPHVLRDAAYYGRPWQAETELLFSRLRAGIAPAGSGAGYVCEQHADVDALPADVLALFHAAERSSIQHGPDWARNFCREVLQRDGRSAAFHVLRRDGRAVALLPLLASRAGALETQVEALGNYYTALHAPALAPDVSGAELALLLRAAGSAHGAGRFRFAPMDPASRAWTLLRDALVAAGLAMFQFHAFGNWYLPSRGLTYADYLVGRSAGLRSTLKRLGKKFAADGGTLAVVTGGTELDDAIAAYEQVYAASWKQAEPYPGFIPGLMRTCAARGWLRLGVAQLAGRPVAAQLWIVAHGRADIYKVAYDDVAKQYSPGSLLTGHLMRHVLDEDRVSEVDYQIGDDAYKQVWMAARRERWGLVAYDPRRLAGLAGLSKEAAGRAVKAWRESRQPAEAAP